MASAKENELRLAKRGTELTIGLQQGYWQGCAMCGGNIISLGESFS